jgi:hypothetical protein
MKLRHTFICIAGAFFAVGLVAFQAGAGGPPPVCSDAVGNLMQIEINALRAGARLVTAGPNQSTNVTAKARILKGTAVAGTTIDTTLTIQALDGATVISTNTTTPVRLGVGKGGKGAKLSLAVPRCTSGFINFVATFTGVDAENDPCEGTRTLRKGCK